MDGFEKRMQQASEEVRESTRRLVPPGVIAPRRAGLARGWLAFAAAFALVAVAVGVLPLLNRGDDPDSVGAPGTTVPVEPATTQTDPSTVSTRPPVTCSGTGVIQSERQDLPSLVLYTREDIIEAAAMCDFATLEGLAAPGFVTSFGGGGAGAFTEWEAAGEGKLGVLQQILNMSYAEQVSGEGQRYYVWPAAFAYDRWEDIPQEYLDELEAIYTDAELAQLAGFGSYAGWRTGISEEGDWMFFVAGD